MNHDSQPTPRSGLCLFTVIALRAEVSSILLDQSSLFLFPTDLEDQRDLYSQGIYTLIFLLFSIIMNK